MFISTNKHKTDERKMQLQKLYDEFYRENCCGRHVECSKGRKSKGYKFSYAAMVGDNYDLNVNGKDVRIMIIGKENPGDNGITEMETPPLDLEKTHNDHYVRTAVTLQKLFGMDLDDEHVSKAGKNYYESFNNKKILSCYCLTNYFHCAYKENYGQRTSISNNAAMKNNCAILVKKEIEILDPTIIICQGKYFADKFWKLIEGNDYEEQGAKCPELYKYSGWENKSPFDLIWTYHPAARGSKNWQKIYSDLFNVINRFRQNEFKDIHITGNDLNQIKLFK